MDDKDLENILQRRHMPKASPDLSERIIKRAVQTEQKESFDIASWVATFFRNLELPSPAVSMAAALVLGLAVGLYLPDTASAQDEEEMIFMYVDDSSDIEGLL